MADEAQGAPSPARLRSRALTEQANALRAEERWAEALPPSFAAVEADPDDLVAHLNLGVLLSKMGRLEEGEAEIRRALAIGANVPTAIHALAHNLLSQGRLTEGWRLYEVRALMPELNTGFPRSFPFPQWKGEPLAGKTLAIFPEQGLGDQIQFARFLPRLIEEAAAVTLLTVPPLEKLFRHNFPDATVVVASGAVEFDDPDCWTTLHDLPGALSVTFDDMLTVPYLTAPGTWPSLGEGFKVGLKAKGNPHHLNDSNRSLPNALAEQLRAGLPGTVISLEPDNSGAGDLADTAAIIAQLDLVVSVDTSVAHLAGAMGKPCLLLLPGFSTDWRWLRDRDTSPWYAGHRLYRGAVEGGWGDAVDRLLRDAHALADPADTSLQDDGIRATQHGRLAEGEALLRQSMRRTPERPALRHALGLNLLMQGRYAEGWPLYEARIDMTGLSDGVPRDFPHPRWRGEDVAGKRLVIFPEQGWGDQIQMARFVPALQATGAELTWLVSPPLVRLFGHSFPNVEQMPAGGAVAFPDPDYWLTLADLPGRLGVRLETLPDAPYCATPIQWSDAPPGFKVGFAARGNPRFAFDAKRSLPPELAEDLEARLPGTVIPLAPEATGARDFAETAAIIKELDLIVSVDTAVAHLAGAMGKPCFLLLPGFATDWRWMRDRDTSPWYPHHRLFRNGTDGDWGEAIDRLVAAVNARAG